MRQTARKKKDLSVDSRYPELRFHPTLREWVVISPRRSLRHRASGSYIKKSSRVFSPKSKCPFEFPQRAGNKDPYFWFPADKPVAAWTLQVFENKYPALDASRSLRVRQTPPFVTVSGSGVHDIVVTRDHDKNFSQLSLRRAADVLRAYGVRYRQIAQRSDIAYISMFQNWGPSAGGTVHHPHYQMIGLPVVPTDVERSIDISRRWYRAHRTCIHCQYISDARREKRRIVYEDRDYIAFTPFASMRPFAVDFFPKKHSAFFENMADGECVLAASALQKVLKKIKRFLRDPDYNFFIHTAPIVGRSSASHYHWHIEIVPHAHIDAGFELGTGIEINPVAPEDAARILRGQGA